jgi:hypothetical protein
MYPSRNDSGEDKQGKNWVILYQKSCQGFVLLALKNFDSSLKEHILVQQRRRRVIGQV